MSLQPTTDGEKKENSLAIVSIDVPTTEQVMRFVFRDLGKDDDCHWLLMNNGTFYTWPKNAAGVGEVTPGSILEAEALDKCGRAALCDYDNNDCVSILPYRDVWPHHPVYGVFSVLREKLGWVIIGKTK